MRNTLLGFLFLTAFAANAQPMLSNGFGSLAAINGAGYQKTTNIGTGNFGNVTGSYDGTKFFASGANTTANKVYYVDAATNSITDSLTLPSNGGDMAGYKEANTLFMNMGTAMYRINTATKTYDSIAIGSPFRIEERPNSKEVWVAADSMIYVVNYVSALSTNTIDLTSNKFDNADVRFVKGGSIAYKAANSTKKIYKIDCNAKTVADSIDTAPYGFAAVEVSADSSKVYAASSNKIYVYSTATKALVDSITSNKQVMNLYMHPTRAELWAVHHFADSVSVYNTTNNAIIASFDIGNDPFFLAFATASSGISSTGAVHRTLLYPNPANTAVHLSFSKIAKHTVVIYNNAGIKVTEQTTVDKQCSIDLRNLPAGSYYTAIFDDGKYVDSVPFVKY
ncbi:MAG: T9SS type A sorting domain-containing protein [Chitinophagales bacterium]|nr:T9SS type A sorting domain-containing protein [Chitinophagales bacterium]